MLHLPTNPVFCVGMTLLLVTAVVHILSAIFMDTKMEYKNIVYTSGAVSGELSGYRIAFLTDIHWYPVRKLRNIAENISREAVDLVLLGGDFGVRRDLPDCLAALADIRSSDGIYGVRGNHDDTEQLLRLMTERGMALLQNRGIQVKSGLFLAGLDDFKKGTPDIDAALSGMEAGSFVLALAHNPDTSMRMDCARLDLMLAGHTHSGEMVLFGKWAPLLPLVSRYGHRFLCGWCKAGDNTDVFVSRGIGSHLFRVFARPQVIYLTLQAEDISIPG